ncbi:MAG TPA: leucine--tRNA ligase [Thermoanaerobaculia bacterium]|nr:leucine--tRNA ligase [Thermoanaerobaculia bacterium]
MEPQPKSDRQGRRERYRPQEIEPRWRRRWDEDRLYEASIDPARTKCYCLTMLPYPSGDLHIGHWYAMTPSDARARFKRMQGYNVMFPIGFDAFGLPAENAAIRRNVHPKEWTYRNIDAMRRQLRTMGAMWDWRREAVSSDPEYYRWTQWFFLKLWQHGLAYRKEAAVDFCPNCNTTLAREQVQGDDRHCERCDTPVVKKRLAQWFFRITDFAEELLDFSKIDWPERVRTLQTHWIGRSEGAEVVFRTSPPQDRGGRGEEGGEAIPIFTTRPDTLWGATFMVLAPEHPLVERVTSEEQRTAVREYVEQTLRQSDIQREAADQEKTGVATGGYAVNPVNQERIPIWIADYVLMTYGTGAIMAVPAHDQRDFQFARRYGLEIRPVIEPERAGGTERGEPGAGSASDAHGADGAMTAAIEERGTMIDSGPLTGTPADQAVARTVAWLEEQGVGRGAVSYRLHDWLISRQRYWGAPIPMIHCEMCGPQPVPEPLLPVVLPDDIEWRPTGESPLKYHPTWKHVACPSCGGAAERETDTMDTFMCSSWYQYRYLSPHWSEGPWDPSELEYWTPVDTYTGGIEHATMHLIYTRFFTKALHRMGLVSFDEPMLQLRNQGTILGEDSEKMSKSRGKVVAPDELVGQYGADTVRAYLMFFARWEQGGPWSSSGIEGVARWLQRVWSLVAEEAPGGADVKSDDERALRRRVHQTIQRVTRDFEGFEFNTVISSLMELTNALVAARNAGLSGSPAFAEGVDALVRMTAPVAPHLAEELWALLGRPYSIHHQRWPEADAEAARAEEFTLVVQVNGKVRDRVAVPVDTEEEAVRMIALGLESVQRHLENRTLRKMIYVPGRLINLVT